MLIRTDDVARKLGCSTWTVRRLVERHELPVVRVGRLVRFQPSAVDRYIRARSRR